MKKFALVIVFLIFCSPLFNVKAVVPYDNYTFSQKDDSAQKEPQAYLPVKVITGTSLGTVPFVNPADIHVTKNNDIYIADAGNNRILILDKNFKLRSSISEFMNNGKKDSLNNPNGVFVADNNNIYVADTDNARIVVFNSQGAFVKVFGKPQASIITANDFNYKPIKIAVDFAYRMFIISTNQNNGMIELDSDGSFNSFYGAVRTTASFFDIFNISFTKEQKANKTRNVPVEYSNVNVDKDGFIYGTVSSVGITNKVNADIFVQKLNPTGIDVLKRNGFFSIMGDINYSYENDQTPNLCGLCDVILRHDGIYAVLGSNSGRVYTYDNNGNLMYTFGGIGNSLGQFSMPVAMDIIGEDKYLVLDRNLNQVVMFEPTQYGSLLTQAVKYYYNREYDKADIAYQKILKYTVKSDVVYNGIGKSLYRNGQYKEAMEYFYLSNDKKMYSEAFQYYRSELASKYFQPFVVVLIISIIIIIVLRKYLKYKKGENNE